jgi:hypothetical protein
MKYVSLILSEDAAHECVSNLGQLGALQFTDLNPEQTPFQRRYVSYIKRSPCVRMPFYDLTMSSLGVMSLSGSYVTWALR